MTVLRAVTAIGLVSVLTPAPAAQMTHVSVQALVTDADGRAVADLTAQDFQIASDGRSRAIESFSAGPSPATIVLLLDASASMDGTVGPGTAVAGLQSALDAWLRARGPSADRWRIASVARQLHLGAEFGSDPAIVLASARSVLAVPDVERFGPSPIWDAVDAGLDVLERETGKRALILVTDGRSTGDRLGVRDAIRHAMAAGVPVSVIGLAPDQALALTANTLLLVRPELALQLVAEQSGGSYVPVFAATDPLARRASSAQAGAPLPSLLDRIVEELHQSYMLEFSGGVADGQAHRLDVTVKRAGLQVHARKALVLNPRSLTAQ